MVTIEPELTPSGAGSGASLACSSGSLSGLMNMGAQAGSAVTAVTTPAIAARYGWTAAYLTAAAFCVLGGMLWLLINPNCALKPREKP